METIELCACVVCVKKSMVCVSGHRCSVCVIIKEGATGTQANDVNHNYCAPHPVM